MAGAESFTSGRPAGRSKSPSAGVVHTGLPTYDNMKPPRSGEIAVKKADIYKVVDDLLYILNTYRGLQIVDGSNPAAPELIAQVPVIGEPIDLHVRNGTAYALINDQFSYGWKTRGDKQVMGHSARSSIWAIDISNPAKPSVLAELPIEGEIEQTQVVGSILYLASRNQGPARVSVQSFDISDPKQIKPVNRIDIPQQDDSALRVSITSNRVALAQSSRTAGVPFTQFTFLDISDASGKIALGTSFSVEGYEPPGRWHMDFDGQTGLFRAVMAGKVGAVLVLWSAPTANQATQVGRLDLPDWFGVVRFDGNRVYAAWALCADQFWIIDTADPAHPVLGGSVEIPGKIDLLEPRGDRVFVLSDDDKACNRAGTLSASLFDVADVAQPKLLSRVSFGSEFKQFGELPKAFQVLDAQSLAIVPLHAWDSSSSTYWSGTQLIDTTRDSLTLRGFAPHSGAISWAFPVRDRVVGLSDRTLHVLDVTDRDHPGEVAQIDLARPVATLAVVKGKAVELAGDWRRGEAEIAVTDASDPNRPTPLARLKIPAPRARVFRDGDILWFLADHTKGSIQALDVSDPTHPAMRGKVELALAINPSGYPRQGIVSQAALVGHALVIHAPFNSIYCNGEDCEIRESRDQVFIYDLSNPDQPRRATTPLLENSAWSWGLRAVGPYAWLTHFEFDETVAAQLSSGRKYVDRIDISDPANPRLLNKVNIPGILFHASSDGQTIYTFQNFSTSNGTLLHQLELTSRDTAVLRASAELPCCFGDALTADGYAYLLAGDSLTTVRLSDLATTNTQQAPEGYWVWLSAVAGGKLFVQAAYYDSGVLIYDLSTPEVPVFEQFVRTDGYVSDIVVDGAKAYIPAGAYGVRVVDLTPGVHPAGGEP